MHAWHDYYNLKVLYGITWGLGHIFCESLNINHFSYPPNQCINGLIFFSLENGMPLPLLFICFVGGHTQWCSVVTSSFMLKG